MHVKIVRNVSLKTSTHSYSNNSVVNECFSNEWKKANIIPVHKKGGKQIIKNYRPVILLPNSSNIFEKIIFNTLFKYLEENKLLNCNKSGFLPGDSFVHQLLSVTQEIYKSSDANTSLEVRGVFLDIFKAFDRVWHNGLLYKLKLSGICGRYYNLIVIFRQQTSEGRSQWSIIEKVSS